MTTINTGNHSYKYPYPSSEEENTSRQKISEKNTVKITEMLTEGGSKALRVEQLSLIERIFLYIGQLFSSNVELGVLGFEASTEIPHNETEFEVKFDESLMNRAISDTVRINVLKMGVRSVTDADLQKIGKRYRHLYKRKQTSELINNKKTAKENIGSIKNLLNNENTDPNENPIQTSLMKKAISDTLPVEDLRDGLRAISKSDKKKIAKRYSYLLNRHNKEMKALQNCEDPIQYYQQLSHRIAYRPYEVGQILPGSSNCKVPNYEIKEIIEDRQGFKALILVPIKQQGNYTSFEESKHMPILLFKGTNNQGDLREDLSPEIGKESLLQNLAEINDKMDKYLPKKKPPQQDEQSSFNSEAKKGFLVMGHSLGGVYAQMMATIESDKFNTCHTFQAPGVDESTWQQYDAKRNQTYAPQVLQHKTENDIITRAQFHLPSVKIQSHHKVIPQNALTSHSAVTADNQEDYKQDMQANKREYEVTTVEKIRRWFGSHFRDKFDPLKDTQLQRKFDLDDWLAEMAREELARTEVRETTDRTPEMIPEGSVPSFP